MSRRLAIATALALLVVVSGCVGGASTAPDTTRTDATTTTTTTEPVSSPNPTTATETSSMPPENTTRVNKDCGYNLHVETASEDEVERADQVYQFSDLATERQEEFRKALSNRTYEMETLPEQWGSPRIVEYDGVEYYTVVSTC